MSSSHFAMSIKGLSLAIHPLKTVELFHISQFIMCYYMHHFMEKADLGDQFLRFLFILSFVPVSPFVDLLN